MKRKIPRVKNDPSEHIETASPEKYRRIAREIIDLTEMKKLFGLKIPYNKTKQIFQIPRKHINALAVSPEYYASEIASIIDRERGYCIAEKHRDIIEDMLKLALKTAETGRYAVLFKPDHEHPIQITSNPMKDQIIFDIKTDYPIPIKNTSRHTKLLLKIGNTLHDNPIPKTLYLASQLKKNRLKHALVELDFSKGGVTYNIDLCNHPGKTERYIYTYRTFLPLPVGNRDVLTTIRFKTCRDKEGIKTLSKALKIIADYDNIEPGKIKKYEDLHRQTLETYIKYLETKSEAALFKQESSKFSLDIYKTALKHIERNSPNIKREGDVIEIKEYGIHIV